MDDDETYDEIDVEMYSHEDIQEVFIDVLLAVLQTNESVLYIIGFY